MMNKEPEGFEKPALPPHLQTGYDAALANHMRVLQQNEELAAEIDKIRAQLNARNAEVDQLNITVTDIKTDTDALRTRIEELIRTDAKLRQTIDNAAAVLNGVPTVRTGKLLSAGGPSIDINRLEDKIRNGNNAPRS